MRLKDGSHQRLPDERRMCGVDHRPRHTLPCWWLYNQKRPRGMMMILLVVDGEEEVAFNRTATDNHRHRLHGSGWRLDDERRP